MPRSSVSHTSYKSMPERATPPVSRGRRVVPDPARRQPVTGGSKTPTTPIRWVLQAFLFWISTRMMPGLLGLTVTVTLPFLPDVTVFEIPGPVILTFAPATPFLPWVTVTLIFWLLPLPLSTFGVTVTVLQISGFTTGGLTGGLAGATTIV